MTLRLVVGALAAIAATAALVAFSQVTMGVAPEPHALVRLSWRAVGERVRECRTPTEAELLALPEHMRMEEICEGRLAPWQLHVRIDGETRVAREVRPSGAREDRPTYVLEELEVPPGPHRVEVSFQLSGASGESLHHDLDARIDPGPRAVVLVTRAADGALVVREDR